MTTNQSYGLDARLRRILMPVSNLDQALATYAEVLVISLLHRDGANYAAVGDGSFAISLLGPAESAHVQGPTVALRLGGGTDLERATHALTQVGCTPVARPRTGPHEVTIYLRDQDGAPFCLYKSLT